MRSMKTTVLPAKTSDQTLEQLSASVAQLQAQNAELKRQLDWFKRQLFGRKSEKRLEVPGQVEMGELFGVVEAATPEPTEHISYTRRRGKQRPESCVTEAGLRFDESVPVEVIELDAPELSGPDAEQYVIIDQKITRRLAQRPGSYVVLEYRRPVVKHKATQAITTVPAPTALFDQSLADVSLIAGMLVDKFVYHLPLYRQHQRLKDAGITLSRTTLTYYTQRAIELLQPIYEAQWRHVLQSKVLAMDETPCKAGRAGKGVMQTTWYWPLYGKADEICFTWSASRGSEHVTAQLKGFVGVLLTDGYAAYDRFAKQKPDITQAQCWAHVRRYFERAEKSDPIAVAAALAHIGGLYQVEQSIRERRLDGQDKLDYRSRHSKPKVEAFFAWCREQRQRMDLVNSEPLAKALTYVANRAEQLCVYLGDPDIPIDTNHLERALRVIPMGRKNWLFNWTEVGARHVGIIQSLLTTCRLQGVEPYTYLVDVLQRISLHPASRIEELTPRVWKECFAADPIRSDLYAAGQ